MPLDASAVAKLLHEFGQRTALRGGNPYRARAYSRAAQNLLALTMPIDQIRARSFRASTSKGAGRVSAICIAPPPCSKPPERICGDRTPA
jgi:DNA polymerase/3'-5' exonuclease PolX